MSPTTSQGPSRGQQPPSQGPAELPAGLLSGPDLLQPPCLLTDVLQDETGRRGQVILKTAESQEGLELPTEGGNL